MSDARLTKCGRINTSVIETALYNPTAFEPLELGNEKPTVLK